MDDSRFPKIVPGVLGGKTFLEIFEGQPKIVEFVNSLWLEDKLTGIFKEFFVYIKYQLNCPILKEEHETRCFQFVKKEKEIPTYLLKYKKNEL